MDSTNTGGIYYHPVYQEKGKASAVSQKCDVESALDVIGGKWKSVVLFYLLDGTKRFSELRRLLPSVTQRMLTLQLRELERDGLVHRRVYAQIPPKVEYSLTDFGRTLEPVLLGLRDWGGEYLRHQRPAESPPKKVAARRRA
jgi:DNA-binding HxlR family transcriptional regulator